MQTSEQVNEIAAAMVAVQAEIEDAATDTVNPNLGNKYSTLSTVLRGIRPVLAKHGVALIQSPGLDVGSEGDQVIDRVTLTTRLLHTSGQWIQGVARARPANVTEKQARMISPVQTVKGAVTALRRTSVLAMVGIAEHDDDGAAPAAAGEQPVTRLGTAPVEAEPAATTAAAPTTEPAPAKPATWNPVAAKPAKTEPAAEPAQAVPAEIAPMPTDRAGLMARITQCFAAKGATQEQVQESLAAHGVKTLDDLSDEQLRNAIDEMEIPF